MYPDLPSVYYLANAGIYLTDHHSGVLIDGLFEHHDGFDFLPESIETAITEKQPPFERLNTLIFTHTHIDHYSPDKVSAFLQRYPQTECLLPDFCTCAESEQSASHRNCTSAVLIRIPSRHLLDKGIAVPHTALFLKYGGQTFFFSGDSDPVYLNRNIPQEILSACRGQVSMAFVNPFFFSLTSGRKFLEKLNAETLFVYHMPLQVPDPLRYHEILDRGLAKYNGPTPVHILNRFMYRLQ